MRNLAKRLALGLATALVTPALISYHLRKPVFGADRALLGSSQALALLPGLFGQYLRRAFYRLTLARFAPSATVEFGTIFSRAGARIGERVYIGPMCHVGLVEIERDVLIAAGVHLPSGGKTHGIDDPARPIREQPGRLQVVRIAEGSWLGSAAVVMADVGRGSVVASGAVVTKPVPERVVVGGVPATVIRDR